MTYKKNRGATVEGVTYDPSALSVLEQALWRGRLKSIERACGCGVGSAAGLVGVGLYVLWLRSGVIAEPNESWAQLTWGFVVFVIAGSFGKVLGIQAAHRKRRRLVEDLRTRLEATPVPSDSIP